MRKVFASLLLMSPMAVYAQADSVQSALSAVHSGVTFGAGGCSGATVIYNTTHASTQGAEIAPVANGAATGLADRIVLGGTNRFICEVQVDMFTLNDNSAFDLTMDFYTDCTSNGGGNTPCGNGAGTLIPASTVTVTGIVAPALGTIFTVIFPYPNLDLSGEVDNTISISLHPSRNNVLWRIGETPVVGALPAGDPATSFVERCGSVGTNNGCSRNFGVNNNFAMQISANTTPVSLQGFSVD